MHPEDRAPLRNAGKTCTGWRRRTEHLFITGGNDAPGHTGERRQIAPALAHPIVGLLRLDSRLVEAIAYDGIEPRIDLFDAFDVPLDDRRR